MWTIQQEQSVPVQISESSIHCGYTSSELGVWDALLVVTGVGRTTKLFSAHNTVGLARGHHMSHTVCRLFGLLYKIFYTF